VGISGAGASVAWSRRICWSRLARNSAKADGRVLISPGSASPLVAVVPYEAATPALVIVGFLMMMQVSGISWKNYELAIPASLTIILMPFTYSITVGIGAGFVSFVIIKIAVGKFREIHPLMWITGGVFVVYFALGPITSLLGV
jgi:AGZA family xanthine/uracil permease-like MFS transporter